MLLVVSDSGRNVIAGQLVAFCFAVMDKTALCSVVLWLLWGGMNMCASTAAGVSGCTALQRMHAT